MIKTIITVIVVWQMISAGIIRQEHVDYVKRAAAEITISMMSTAQSFIADKAREGMDGLRQSMQENRGS